MEEKYFLNSFCKPNVFIRIIRSLLLIPLVLVGLQLIMAIAKVVLGEFADPDVKNKTFYWKKERVS